MRAVVQRVHRATCRVDGEVTGKIETGLLVFLGITGDDTEDDLDWLCRKIPQIRIFPDDEGLMNRSVQDIEGGILLISQFTLYGNLRKGTRPSFNRSAPPDEAERTYGNAIQRLTKEMGKPVGVGKFGGDMQIDALNDGPVTLIIDTKDKRF